MEENKYKKEMDEHMTQAPQMPQIQQVPQMVETPHMYQMPQMMQAPQMPVMCCPYLMNMQCPMIQMPSTCGTGQTYMSSPYMYRPYGW